MEVYQRVTDRIIELLERGVVPWRRPWAGGPAGFPKSLASGRAYRGVNVFMLHAAGFESPWWITYKQARERGGHVRKGEKGWPVVFWKWLEREERDPATGEPKTRKVPLLRQYSVFNVAQCGEIDAPAPPDARTFDFDPIEEAEAVVQGMPKPPTIGHGQNRAAYCPASDHVGMPRRERFERPAEYYSTLFHELAHATGHPERLGRFPEGQAVASLGSPTYGREELIAEMGAAFLCGRCSIADRTVENSAAYIDGWLEKLRSDKRLVVMAAAQAQKAADFILGTEPAE